MKSKRPFYWRKNKDASILGQKVPFPVHEFFALGFTSKRYFHRASVVQVKQLEWFYIWYDAYGQRQKWGSCATWREVKDCVEARYADLEYARRRFVDRHSSRQAGAQA